MNIKLETPLTDDELTEKLKLKGIV